MQPQLDVDPSLLKAAMAATGLPTERAVVEAGLRLLVQLNEQVKFRELRGQVRWEGDLNESRRAIAASASERDTPFSTMTETLTASSNTLA